VSSHVPPSRKEKQQDEGGMGGSEVSRLTRQLSPPSTKQQCGVCDVPIN